MNDATRDGLRMLRDHYVSQAKALTAILEHPEAIDATEDGAAAVRATVRRTCKAVGVDPDTDAGYQTVLSILGMIGTGDKHGKST